MAGMKPLPRKPLPDTARSSLDLNCLSEPEYQRPGQTTSGNLHRKPLPVPARSSLDLGHSRTASSQISPSYADSSSDSRRERQRKETASRESDIESRREATELAGRPTHNQAREETQRRPLGPRPLGSEIAGPRKPLPGIENQPLTFRSQSQNFTQSKTSSDSDRSVSSHYDDIKADGLAKSFSITIIRRDPGSGAQWNVGTVTGECHSQGPKAMLNTKKPNFNISVHLITPGYTSFRSSQIATYVDGQPQLLNRQTAEDKLSTAPSDWGFDRQVCMEGSSFFERTTKQHRRSQSDSLDNIADPHDNSVATLPGGKQSSNATDTHDSGSKGYVFLSPWGGRCKFTTGGGGRSKSNPLYNYFHFNHYTRIHISQWFKDRDRSKRNSILKAGSIQIIFTKRTCFRNQAEDLEVADRSQS